MNMLDSNNGWRIPVWHEDFGDPVDQYQMLFRFSHELINTFSFCTARLDVYEEGEMKVDIYLYKEKVAELYVVPDMDSEGYRYGLFCTLGEGEEEFYFYKIIEGLEFFKKRFAVA